MGMREDDSVDVVEAFTNVVKVGQDQVDTGLVVFWEQHPAIDDQQASTELEYRHVPADFAQPTKRNDAQGLWGERRWRAEL